MSKLCFFALIIAYQLLCLDVPLPVCLAPCLRVSLSFSLCLPLSLSLCFLIKPYKFLLVSFIHSVFFCKYFSCLFYSAYVSLSLTSNSSPSFSPLSLTSSSLSLTPLSHSSFNLSCALLLLGPFYCILRKNFLN